MSSFTRKFSSIALTITTIVWVGGATVSMPVAQAATAADLQAQINALLAQIQTLQAQLGTTSSQSTSSYNFTRDLTVGSKGADVTALQGLLISSGDLKISAPTVYFGSMTKAALVAYQKAKGISPASGYFGPKSRAYVASVAATTPSTTTTTPSTTTTTPTTPTTAPVVAPASGLQVSLASDNPPAGGLISSTSAAAARVPVLKFNLTAGNASGVTVSDLQFTKIGVLSDSSISSAYLVESGKVIQQYSSLNKGVLDFSGLGLSIAAGQTRIFTLAIDPATGLTAGNTVAFSIASNASITSVDASNNAITETGAFPLNGNTMTVTSVSNPSIASVTIASSSIGTSVYAGTTGVLASAWTVTTNSSPVNLTSINFKVIGSAAKSDLRNVKLMVNGTQVGSTLAAVGTDGSAYFDLTSSPAKLNTGTSNLQVYADVMGSPNFDFQFELLNTYDVYAVDTQYNVPVSVTINGGTDSSAKVTISNGQITVTAASDTPTGNIAKGASGVTVAKFNIYAAGEAVKIKYIDARLATDASNASGSVQNIYLVDDQGNQIGTTINTITANTTSGTCTVASQNLTCHFGSSSSNINYIIPANTTRTISLRTDILSGATGWATLTGSLPGGGGDNSSASNLQGLTSSQSANSGSASGAALTLASTPLTASKNGAVGTQTFAKGAANAKIGSYVLTASAAEGVNISNLTIKMTASSTDFQNLKIMVGGVQFGTTKTTLSGSDQVAFAGSSAIAVPSGSSKTVDVYADILSSASAQTNSKLTQLLSCTGSGATTYSSVSCSPTALDGQNVTVSASPSISINLSSNTAPKKQVVMGSTSNSLVTFRFVDTANVENVKITKLVVTASSTNGASQPSFSNVNAYMGTTLLGGPVSASSTGNGGNASSSWAYVFNFSNPVPTIPQNGSLEVNITGDVANFSSGGASSSGIYIFKIASSTSDVTAIGASSNSAINTAHMSMNTPNGNQITVLRTKLTLSASTLGVSSSRNRTTTDDLASLVFAADAGYDATVNTITLTFSGSAVSNDSGFKVHLIDSNTNADWSGLSSAGVACTVVTNSCTTTFSLTTATIPVISAGTSKSIKVRVDSSNFYQAASVSPGLTALINANTDVNWGDGTTTGVGDAGNNLESTAAPLTLFAGSYSQ